MNQLLVRYSERILRILLAGGAYDTVPEVNLLLSLFNTSDSYVPILFDEAGESSLRARMRCSILERPSVYCPTGRVQKMPFRDIDLPYCCRRFNTPYCLQAAPAKISTYTIFFAR